MLMCSPLIQSLAEEQINSTLNFFFFNIPSSCFLSDAFAALEVPIDFSPSPFSLALKTLPNRQSEVLVVGSYIRLGENAPTVIKFV